jgi:O-antigen ligase
VRELVNLSLFLILLVAATDLLVVHPRRIRALVISLAVVGGLCGILAVMEAAGIWRGQFPLPGTSLNRATLGFGWPNELAMFLAMILPLTLHTFQAARGAASRSLAFAAIAATAMGLAATFSRGSWLAVFTSALVLLLVRRSPSMFRAWALALAGVLVINFLFGGAVQNRIMQTMTDPYIVQRAALTWAGLLMFQAHPIVGVGPGGFGANLDRFGPQIDILWDYVGSAHNAYVEVAAEMGIIGLAAFLFLLIAIFTRLFRGARRAELDPAASEQDRSLRRALLWSFATFCAVAWTAWPLAHGLGQLAMLVAAAGFALDTANARRADAVR